MHELAHADRVRGVGPGEALAHVAAELAESLGLLVRLDALRDDRDAEAVGQ